MKNTTVLMILSVFILLVVGLFVISSRRTTTAPTVSTPTSESIKKVNVTPEPSSVATGGAVIEK